MKYILALLTLIVFSTPCYSKNSGWIDVNGNPVPDSEFKKTVNGFGGWLLITSDQNWLEKWNTPSDRIPSFKKADEVKRGGKISILPLFINATRDDDNRIQLLCDIKIINPQGESTFDKSNIECFNEIIDGSNTNVMMAYTVIDIIADNNEPVGEWTVLYDILDKNGNNRVSLKTRFELKE